MRHSMMMEISLSCVVALLVLPYHTQAINNNTVLSVCDRSNHEERLQLQFMGKCHPVCSEGFTVKEATVACRELGKNTAMVRITHEQTIGEGLVPVHWSMCTGSEKRLSQCYMVKLQHCTQGYAGVMCTDESIDTEVILDKKHICVYGGSNVTVACKARGTLHHSHYWYQWTLANTTLPDMAPSVTIQVNNTRKKQTLTCSVFERDKKLGQSSVNVDVYYPPPPYIETTCNALRGSHVNLTDPHSVTSNPPPNYTWGLLHYNSTPAFNHPSRTAPIIPSISKSGVYIIRMSNWMNVTRGIPRTGHGVRIVTVNVVEPLNTTCVEHRYITENRSVALPCVEDPSGMFDVNVSWTRLDENKTKQRYEIVNVDDDDNGTYTCTADFKLKDSSDGGKRFSCNTTLHILGQANETKQIATGANITWRNFTTSGMTSYNWTKLEGDQLTNTTFPNVMNLEKSDSGLYVGKQKDNVETLIELQVLYEPEVTCKQYVVIPIGGQRELTCTIDAFPLDTDITWSHPGGLVSNDNVQRRGQNKTIFDITSARWDDEGVYNCTVNNTQGSDYCEITVNIISGGEQQSNLAVGIVSGVFSTIVLAMLLVILFLAWKLYRDRKGRNRKDSMISLPLKTTAPSQEVERGKTGRSLPKAPAKDQLEAEGGMTGRPLPNAPGKNELDNSFQQDVYENA